MGFLVLKTAKYFLFVNRMDKACVAVRHDPQREQWY